MGIEAAFADLLNTDADVGTVVRNALEVRAQICQIKAQINRTLALPQPLNMTLLDFHVQTVNDLFERFDPGRQFQVFGLESPDCHVQDLFHRRSNHRQFLYGTVRELVLFGLHVFEHFFDVARMITDPFKIVNTVQKDRKLMRILRREMMRIDFHQIGTQLVLIMIDLLFQIGRLRRLFRIVFLQKVGRLVKTFLGFVCHLHGGNLRLSDRKGRSVQETGVQNGDVFFLFRLLLFLLIHRYRLLGKLHQDSGNRDKERCGNEIDHRMNHSDARHSCLVLKKGKMQKGIQRVKKNHKKAGLDHIEIQMHQSSPFSVFACPHGGKNGSDTGTDLCAHYHRNRYSVGDRHGGGKRLHDTDGSCRRLNDHGKPDPDKESEQGIIEFGQKRGERGYVLERRHGRGHHGHAVHQDGKADQNFTGVLTAFLVRKHLENHPDQCQKRRKRCGFKHVDQHVIRADRIQG